MLSSQLHPGRCLTFVGGKGGVGKTTVAAALAVELADRGERVCVVSVDPAHSLGDALGIELGSAPQEVDDATGLQALEIDANAERNRFLEQHGASLDQLIERGTYLDASDVQELTGLNLPGMDEVAALLSLSRLADGSAGRLIVDTAPTGHTLRLLELPELALTWVEALEAMERKDAAVSSAFTGRVREDSVTSFLRTLRADVEALAALLHDPDSTRFVLVTTTEPMVLAETERLRERLEQLRVASGGVVVNRHSGPAPEAATGPGVTYVPLLGSDLGGLAGLRRFAREASPHPGAGEGAAGGTGVDSAPADRSTSPAGTPSASAESSAAPASPGSFDGPPGGRHFSESSATAHRAVSVPPPAADPPSTPAFDAPAGPDSGVLVGGAFRPPLDRRLYFVGGKGGVGKSTAAAALGVLLADLSSREVLLLSVDPAGSLGEVLGFEVDGEPRPVAGTDGLLAQQMDAEASWSAFTDRYRNEVDEIFGALTSGAFSADLDRQVMERLVDLAPPGVDELMALMEVIDLTEDRPYDAVVLDTAPTGHLLRLLEAPEVALDWSHALLRLLLKYREVTHLGGGLGERVLKLSKSLRLLREQLADADATYFLTVALSESLSVPETARLLRRLREMKMPSGALLVNRALTPSGQVPQGVAPTLRRLLEIDPAAPGAAAPRLVPAPRGAGPLRDFIAGWRRVEVVR